MAQIFVSYSRKNIKEMRAFVSKLESGFGADGIFYDTHTQGGKPWWNTILQEIEITQVFVYLISNDSLSSFACRAEYLEAMRLGKHIVLVDITDDISLKYTDPPLAYILSNIQRLKHTNISAVVRAITQGFTSSNAGHYKEQILHLSVGDWSDKNINIGSNAVYNIAYVIQEDITPIQQPAQGQAPAPVEKHWWRKPEIIIVIIAAIITGIFGLWQGVFANSSNNTINPTAISEVARVVSETPINITDRLTLTSTPSPTDLPISFIVQTADARETANIHATEYGLQTQSVLDQTATATLWTSTPTPNMTASIESFRTSKAETETQEWISSWTSTPTPTASATFTPTPTETASPIRITPVLTTTPFFGSFEIELLDSNLLTQLGSRIGGGAKTEDEAAYQEFENGFMFFRSGYPPEQSIFVLYPGGLYKVFPNLWHWGVDNPIREDAEPPENLFQPVNGFGLTWLDDVQVREDLGWATSCEISIDLLIQTFTNGVLLRLETPLRFTYYEPECGDSNQFNGSTFVFLYHPQDSTSGTWIKLHD